MALKRLLPVALGLAAVAAMAGCFPILPADYPDTARHAAAAASAPSQAAH